MGAVSVGKKEGEVVTVNNLKEVDKEDGRVGVNEMEEGRR